MIEHYEPLYSSSEFRSARRLLWTSRMTRSTCKDDMGMQHPTSNIQRLRLAVHVVIPPAGAMSVSRQCQDFADRISAKDQILPVHPITLSVMATTLPSDKTSP